tara:strand:- start:1033 stop:1224 length:192 start_codon:yes stop_codon:yes gene_type:complete
LLKSEIINDKTKPKKLIITDTNCNKESDKILLSKIPLLLKSLNEKKINIIENASPKINEKYPI